jgi:hypothetical protein
MMLDDAFTTKLDVSYVTPRLSIERLDVLYMMLDDAFTTKLDVSYVTPRLSIERLDVLKDTLVAFVARLDVLYMMLDDASNSMLSHKFDVIINPTFDTSVSCSAPVLFDADSVTRGFVCVLLITNPLLSDTTTFAELLDPTFPKWMEPPSRKHTSNRSSIDSPLKKAFSPTLIVTPAPYAPYAP